MEINFKDKFNNYIKAVESGEWIAGKWQQLAVKRHLKDLKRKDLVFDIDEGERWCKFFNVLKLSIGEKAGERFILEDWQTFLIMSIYGWQKENRRRFRNVYIEIARKNGKSTLVSGMALGALLIDKESAPQVYSAATKSDQARIIFEECGRMVRGNKVLSEKLNVFRDSIVCKSNSGSFKPLASDSKTLDGLNVHFAAIDEIHAHKTAEVIELLDTAKGARKQPLIVEITTAGSNKNTICYKHHEYTKKILEGTLKNDAWFGVVYSIDDKDDWKDSSCWIKANPNLGISFQPDELQKQFEKAVQMPSFMNSFQRLHMNKWTGSITRWISDELWISAKEDYNEDDLRGLECVAGCDLASVGDTNSISVVFRCEDNKIRTLNYFFIPEETKNKKYELDSIDFPEWVRNGDVLQFNTRSRDEEMIIMKLQEISQKFKLKMIVFDRWQSETIVSKLESVGVECMGFGQGYKDMDFPTKKLEELLINEELKHNGNACMRWQVSNIMISRDPADNIKIDKSKSSEKVDGPVSLVMALGGLLNSEMQPTSINYAY
jgi:phage terminase large subunit-like protein